jgi:chemotaxis protein CheD
VSFEGEARGEAGVSEMLWTYSPLEPAKRVYLAPGQLFASADRVQVTTILGSCVAVCLFDIEAQVGGVNHFLLPTGAPPSPRFGEYAVPQLVDRVVALGAELPRLRAKLFGGACVLEALRASSALGTRNVEAARERLAAERIPVVAEDTGGDLGRKLIFEIQTGSAWIRAIDANSRQ